MDVGFATVRTRGLESVAHGLITCNVWEGTAAVSNRVLWLQFISGVQPGAGRAVKQVEMVDIVVRDRVKAVLRNGRQAVDVHAISVSFELGVARAGNTQCHFIPSITN